MSRINQYITGFVFLYFILAWLIFPTINFFTPVLPYTLYILPLWILALCYLLICAFSHLLAAGRKEKPWYANKVLLLSGLILIISLPLSYRLSLNYLGYCKSEDKILSDLELCQVVIKQINGSVPKYVFLHNTGLGPPSDLTGPEIAFCEIGTKRSFKAKGPEKFHPIINGPKKQLWGRLAGTTRDVVVIDMDGVQNAYMRTNCGISNTNIHVRSFWDLIQIFKYPSY